MEVLGKRSNLKQMFRKFLRNTFQENIRHFYRNFEQTATNFGEILIIKRSRIFVIFLQFLQFSITEVRGVIKK